MNSVDLIGLLSPEAGPLDSEDQIHGAGKGSVCGGQIESHSAKHLTIGWAHLKQQMPFGAFLLEQ